MNIDEVIDGLLGADDTSYHAAAKHDTKYQRQAGPEGTHGVGDEATATATTSQQVVQQHRHWILWDWSQMAFLRARNWSHRLWWPSLISSQ